MQAEIRTENGHLKGVQLTLAGLTHQCYKKYQIGVVHVYGLEPLGHGPKPCPQEVFVVVSGSSHTVHAYTDMDQAILAAFHGKITTAGVTEKCATMMREGYVAGVNGLYAYRVPLDNPTLQQYVPLQEFQSKSDQRRDLMRSILRNGFDVKDHTMDDEHIDRLIGNLRTLFRD